MPEAAETWQTLDPGPRFRDTNLMQMVELARRARLEGLAGEEAVGRAIRNKYDMLKSGVIDYRQCSRAQVKITGKKPFDGINLALKNIASEGEITAEDIWTGFAIYSVTILCDEAVHLDQFLESLVLTQTPRTIIQATVNTIHLDAMKDKNRKQLGRFYQELNKTFNFHHGRILVALSSPSELEALLARDLPYLTPYRQQIEECIRGTSCQGVSDLLQDLGNISPCFIPCLHLHLYIISDAPPPQTRPPEK
jgi:hypothetical protein